MQPPQVFVLAPFDQEGRRVQDIVRRAIQKAGLGVVQYSDAIRPGAELTSTILDAIRAADLIIADISRQDSNVFYEIGFAHALRKRTMLLISIKSGSRLPSDFDGLQYFVYDPENLEHLAATVTAETRALTMPRCA